MGLERLIADAKITFFGVEGIGLGAVLVSIVAVVFLLRSRGTLTDFVKLAKALRKSGS